MLEIILYIPNSLSMHELVFPVTRFGQVVSPFQTTCRPHHQNNDTNYTDHSVHLTCAKDIIKNYWHFAGSVKVHGFTSFYHSHLHVLLMSRWKPTLQEDIATAESRLGRLKHLSPIKWMGHNRGQKCELEHYLDSWLRPLHLTAPWTSYMARVRYQTCPKVLLVALLF